MISQQTLTMQPLCSSKNHVRLLLQGTILAWVTLSNVSDPHLACATPKIKSCMSIAMSAWPVVTVLPARLGNCPCVAPVCYTKNDILCSSHSHSSLDRARPPGA